MGQKLSKLAASMSLVVSIGITCPNAVAGGVLDDIWDGMLVTSTGAASYKSTGRVGKSFGAFSLRIKTYNPNLISVRAPHLQVGCSGIDMFGGALSLISKEELVQMGRAIISAAPMYAFQLALDQLCPDCNAIMADIAKRLEKLNDMVKGDCESINNFWANVTNTTPPSERERGTMFAEYQKKADTFTSSIAESKYMKGLFSSSSDLASTSGVEIEYNTVAQAFMKTSEGFSFNGMTKEKTLQLIMTLVGTEIKKKDSTGAAGEGDTVTSQRYPRLELKDLYKRETKPHAMYKCNDTHSEPMCLDFTEVDVTSDTDPLYVKPFYDATFDLLCKEGGTSVIDRIPRKEAISAAQENLLGVMGPSMHKLLTSYGADPDIKQAECKSLADLFAIEATINLGQNINKLFGLVEKSTEAKEKKFVDLTERKEMLNRDIEALVVERRKVMAQMQLTSQLTKNLQEEKG